MPLLRVIGSVVATAALAIALACTSTNTTCSDTESQPPCVACPGSPPAALSCEQGEWVCHGGGGPCAESSEDAGPCAVLGGCGGELVPSDASDQPIRCDPDASDPCDPGKDDNPCVTRVCDPKQRVCVWVPVEPLPSGCVGADAASDAVDAADAADE
jgi:hypothetical protein